MSDVKKRVTILVNGEKVEDEAGKPLLQVLLDHGYKTPHFCYHPGIGVEGSCRLCLVEIEGQKKLATSCTVPMAEGLSVKTESLEVKKSVKGVLEFFLLNHPLDCPFCDKGGECPLQNYTLDSFQNESRFSFEKLHMEKHQVIGDHIILDKERCVLCDRCVRFLRDRTGREELQIRNRGAHSEIFVPEGKSLTTGYTGNLADICPVGALTSRDYRFKARPWEQKTTDTVCGECSLHCSVQLWRKEDKPLRLTPRIEPEVNEWWICDRGRYSLDKNLKGDRITVPYQRPNGKEVTGESVFNEALASLKKVKEGTTALVLDSSVSNEEVFLIQRFAERLGRASIYVPVETVAREFYKKMKEANLLASFPEDCDAADAVWVLGENMELDHPILPLRLRRLYQERRISLFTSHNDKTSFEDIAKCHSTLNGNVFSAPKGEFIEKLRASRKIICFVSEGILTSEESSKALEAQLRDLSSEGRDVRVSILFHSVNARGMMDLWNDKTVAMKTLMKDIKEGKIQALFWMGKTFEEDVFHEYVKGMKAFVQVAFNKADVHPGAKWILPLESFLEKRGTFTNTFGKVQRLRKAAKVVEKGMNLTAFLKRCLSTLGEKGEFELETTYAALAEKLTQYPKSITEIPESDKTYSHYERALWRL